jgi:hypothetical protein
MSSYSPDLRIELIDSGAQAGTWGTTTNNTFAYLLEAAIAGYQTVSVTSASQALTHINGASATAGDNQSVYAMLRFTTTTGAAFNVYAPPVSKQYIVWNNSGYAMTIYNSTVIGNTTAAGTGITVVNGAKVMVWSDGTNFNELQAANLTGTLAVANGGTGATSFTSGALLKGAGTAAVSAASAADIAGQIGTLPVANGGTGVTTAAAITSLVGSLLFPVGAIYSSTSSTNPGTSLGFGTWTQFAAGRMMMGAGGSFSPGTTGGSNDAITVSHTHTASVSDPGHRHGYDDAYFAEVPNSGILGSGDSDYDNSYVYRSPRPTTDTVATGISVSVSTTGSSGTNANLPPYIVVYMWQRTA